MALTEILYKQYSYRLEEYYTVHVLKEEIKVSRMGFKLALPITGWGGGVSDHGRPGRYKSWLFDQGIVLVQKDKKLYLRFFNEHDASLFMLKWS